MKDAAEESKDDDCGPDYGNNIHKARGRSYHHRHSAKNKTYTFVSRYDDR